ncbi:MAG: hypothetical protein ACFFAO_07315 [Candidatus Hermodarchaeota archaeon]
MSLSDLSIVDLIVGITYSIYISVFIIIGIKIILKYIEHKHIELVSVGLTAILISSVGWDNLYYFIHILLYGEPDELLFTFLIHTFRIFVPLALLLWMYSFTKLVPTEKKNQTIILIVYFIILIISLIMYIFALLVDFSNILGAGVETIFTIIYYMFLTVTLVFFMISILTTGVLIVRESSKSGDPKAKIKSNFLLSAFLISSIATIIMQISLSLSAQGGVYDQYHISPSVTLIFVITHIFIALSGILLYFGFFLPEKVYHRIKKSNN